MPFVPFLRRILGGKRGRASPNSCAMRVSKCSITYSKVRLWPPDFPCFPIPQCSGRPPRNARNKYSVYRTRVQLKSNGRGGVKLENCNERSTLPTPVASRHEPRGSQLELSDVGWSRYILMPSSIRKCHLQVQADYRVHVLG